MNAWFLKRQSEIPLRTSHKLYRETNASQCGGNSHVIRDQSHGLGFFYPKVDRILFPTQNDHGVIFPTQNNTCRGKNIGFLL